MSTKNILQKIVQMNTENHIILEDIRNKFYKDLERRRPNVDSDIIVHLDSILYDTSNVCKELKIICQRMEEMQTLSNLVIKENDIDTDTISNTSTKRKMKV